MGANRVGLGDPSRLKPFDAADKQLLRVVIETPKGSRNKYAFDLKNRVFELKKVLPAGMAFPYDFGFVPSTLADDGDPVDVLLLMDEPAFPGCVLSCRALGVIEGEQGDKKSKSPVRNDRIVAIEKDAHSWDDVAHSALCGNKSAGGAISVSWLCSILTTHSVRVRRVVLPL